MDRSNLSLFPRYSAKATASPTGVGPGQCPAADTGVEAQAQRGHGLYHRGAFHVAQLAPVEVAVGLNTFGPSQVDVAGRLHHALALHDPFAGLLEPALGKVVLQHRGGGLLDLEEQRVALVWPWSKTMNARVPTLPTPTTLRAMSTISNRSSKCRRSVCRVIR